MADATRVSALLTVEVWPDAEPTGYVVRALLRTGGTARDVIGPVFAGSLDDVRGRLTEMIEAVLAML